MNTESENVARPHIGLEMREKDWTYGLYLINPGEARYSRVASCTGAFCSDDDRLVQTSNVFKEHGPLEPKSYLVLEESDWGALDFVIWYHLDLYLENQVVPERVQFSIPKYGYGPEKRNLDELPVLHRKGRRIALGMRAGN